MVERVLKMLQQFLISNQTLKLNETFKVYLKVLSIDHMKHKSKTRTNRKMKNVRKKHYGVHVRPTKRFNYFWALDVPESYPKETTKNIFKNKCLLTGTILGLLQNAYFKSNRNDKRYIYVQNINSTVKAKQNHAGNVLVEELENLISQTQLPKNGPYELESTVKILSKFYSCQFFIFDGIDNSNKLLFQYPTKYDDTLIPIYLYQPNDEPNHVVFIRHLMSYFKANVKICLGCKQIFSTYNYRHLCPQKKSCFSCRRFFCSEATYLHEKLLFSFCDKNITKEIPILCPLCNVTCYSNHCFNGHKLLCSGKGTFGYKCLKCNKFTYRHGNLNGIDIKKQHNCGQLKQCNFCRQEQEENHLCKLKKELIINHWPKLAFINFEQCIERTNDNNQDSDLKVESEPIVAIIFSENDELSGLFSKYVFSYFYDEPLMTVEKNVFLYKSKNVLNSKITSKFKIPSKKSQDFIRNLDKLHKKESIFYLTDKILQEITTTKWQNTTFICQDQDSRTYMALLNAFIRNGFCPNVVKNGRHIILMEIRALGLRFLTSNSYFKGDEFEIGKQFNLDFSRTFFPKKFFESKNFSYQGQIPNILYFLSNLDSKSIVEEKKAFVANFKKQKYIWNFQKELLQFSELKIWLLMLSCLTFIDECISFETLVKTSLNLSNNVILNPFSFPLCSLSGYSYKFFKYFYLNNYDIYVVKNEFGMNLKNVSKLEYEWSTYMDFKYKEKCFISAFNNEFGQKAFREAIPDLYSPITKQAYFFHGCVFHGHYDKCLINPKANAQTRNPFGITFKELNEKFETQAINLLQNNETEINEVIYQWECHYKNLRENDSCLKTFLNTNFQPHPLLRLKPRSCVRGAFFDVYALRWSKALFQEETLHFIDVNGLYSHVI